MIVIPMAGLSSRFFSAGYKIPKYMLKLNGETVFYHAIHSFKNQFGTEEVLIICRNEYDTEKFINQQCANLGLGNTAKVCVLDKPTEGQAETVESGLSRVGVADDIPLTIFNIDTFRPNFEHPSEFSLTDVDGYVEVFRGDGTHWSFVRPDMTEGDEYRVLEVTEKIRISDLCSTGLYYFASRKMFGDLYNRTLNQDATALQGGERYIAPLYSDAIKLGYDIRYRLIDESEVQFCGTPEEFERLKSK